ncbi:lipopolysaccharide biosynthesis protein [Leptolyngbya sp. AN02str]|uniref:lipopolysaccharide biosynthesis protein n=1 Tax=Leptolyngbya sp. AN02str TaxID=3423363 RepID=UPI003D30FD66
MIPIKTFVPRIQKLLSDQFIRNAGWTGGGELLNRVFRLVTTVTLARVFSSYDYGLIAIIYTVNEFASVFTLKYGIGAKIIQAEEEKLATICNTAYWLNWILCITIFLIQLIGAFPIAMFYGDRNLILPLCVAAIAYLMHPFFLVQISLIQRENRLKVTAMCTASQSFISNILTAALAIAGAGIWAVVIPMVVVNPVWIVAGYRCHSWRPTGKFSLDGWQDIAKFGGSILGVELLNKLRGNLDYLLVGRFLGVEALGLYFFAFNAGLGISLNVLSALIGSLFPHLCEVRGSYQKLRDRYMRSLRVIATILTPVIVLQSSLSPFYVPIVFGEKWIPAVPILIMICLSALPRAFAMASASLMDSVGKAHITLMFDLVFTVVFAIVLLIAIQFGIYWVAASVLISHAIVLPIYSIAATRYVFSKTYNLSSS